MEFSNDLSNAGLNYIKQKTEFGKWKGTSLEEYEMLNPKAKGKFGEGVITFIAENYGLNVQPHKDENDDYDLIINGIKTEAKFSGATERNYKWQFTFNHIAMEKDWDRLILMGINGDLQYKIVWFTKDEIAEIMQCESFLNHQQGGKYSKNDDFMCSQNKATKLLNHSFAKTLNQWN